eukprot:GHUV01038527.1.p1 GENE.GHUV01038527.1~~GHUV01038527.1.p1  ORF type:complete len:136 (+),score=29.64 GHUV01038527.1:578-985(+)
MQRYITASGEMENSHCAGHTWNWDEDQGGHKGDDGPHYNLLQDFDHKYLNDDISTDKWVARDGANIDYGAIGPEEDFYDPSGKKLFDDEANPDGESYEGYTGNSGQPQHSCINSSLDLQGDRHSVPSSVLLVTYR